MSRKMFQVIQINDYQATVKAKFSREEDLIAVLVFRQMKVSEVIYMLNKIDPEVPRDITATLKAYLNGPYPTYKHVPGPTKDALWKKFNMKTNNEGEPEKLRTPKIENSNG
ncbi:lipid-transfer protein [Striga asiatica]|uniref:Lipid-transfer protein n=1 Tax=Striga asiatica TaxID=4170 RepID=A0A5A7RE77_STRAF|nr:lipid-transfer protein [Striga asiatica]